MAQKQYVEKPFKVLAEQWNGTDTEPLQAGVDLCGGTNIEPMPGPHVHTSRGMVLLRAGDWIVKDLWRDEYQVIADAEFSERFGGGALAEGG